MHKNWPKLHNLSLWQDIIEYKIEFEWVFYQILTGEIKFWVIDKREMNSMQFKLCDWMCYLSNFIKFFKTKVKIVWKEYIVI